MQNKGREGADGTKSTVTYSHPKPVIAIIHMRGADMPFRSDGSSYTEGDVRDPLPVVVGKTGGIPFSCPSVFLNSYGQVWEHASVLIRILKLSVYKKCKSINPLMETIKEIKRSKHGRHTGRNSHG